MSSLPPAGSRVAARVLFASLVLVGLLVGADRKPLRAQDPVPSSAAARATAARKAPGTGKKAIDVKDPEVIDGPRYQTLVKERRGKPLMVAFWATWCEPCREEYPMVIDLSRQYGGKGLTVMGVSLDEDAEIGLVRRFLARTAPGFPNYRKKPGNEDAFINMVNPQWSGALPATFFYSSEGRLIAQIVGEVKREAFEATIRKVLNIS